MYPSSNFLIISSTSLIFIGYLNTCTSNNYEEADSLPKLWPNISINSSDFSFASIVNHTRYIPSIVAAHGNYTLLQIGIMVAVGALLTGAVVLAGEAHFIKIYYDDLMEDPVSTQYNSPIYGSTVNSPQYGAPSPPQYGAPSPPQYGAPNPPQYGAPNPPQYGTPSPSNNYG